MGQREPRSVGTHNGAFHADEVTACALLILFNRVDLNRVVRTRDPAKLAECEYVCDVGGIYDISKKLFDHHQSEYQGSLSSAGMVLSFLRESGDITSEEFDFFNNSLVKGVDAHDNGRAPQESGYASFSHIVANFAPISYESKEAEQNGAFFKALDFALGHLKRLHERYLYNLACRNEIAEEMKKRRRFLYFDHALPWLEGFFALGGREHPALFVVMPAGEHWKVRAIPPDYAHRMELRLGLPADWAGLLGEDLKKVTAIPGAIFCHKGRFTSVWETKEDAVKALKKVFERYGIAEEVNI